MPAARGKGNVPGKYYVANCCIFCELCLEMAPANFEPNYLEGYAYICKQPDSPEETELCRGAINACPINAIWDDGEHFEE